MGHQRGQGDGGVGRSPGAPSSNLLQNRHYIGEIVHKDEVHPGLHAGIVDRKLFDAVQRKVARNRVVQRRSHTRAAGAALTGRIFDAEGRPLSPTFSYGKQGRLYRYYVAADLQQGTDLARHPDTPRSLPADPLEAFVVTALRRLADHPLGTWEDLEGILHRVEVRPSDTHLILLAIPLFRGDHPDLALEDLRGRLSPGERAVQEWGDTQRVRITLPHRLQFRGGRTWKDRGSPRGRATPPAGPHPGSGAPAGA